MPRRLFNRLRPVAERIRHSRYVEILGPKLRDSRLWAVNRRAITSAFGVGIAIQFIPLPVHLPLGLVMAMLFHLNVPAIVATMFIVNPFTAVPVYYFAYRVGALLLGSPPGKFAFELGWSWLGHGLGSIWKPFLLGCLVCAIVLGFAGRWLLELAWRWSIAARLAARRTRVRR
ncbi:MAG: DUF2062 domain-containing protein [Steroidobacteraceae bacterium]